MVKTKIAFVDDEYVAMSIIGNKVLLEYRIDGNEVKEFFGIRKGKRKYYELLNYLLGKHEYIFEVS